MVKIVGETETLKKLKNQLHIDNLKDYLLLSKKIKLEKEELIEEGHIKCREELCELKKDIVVGKNELEEYLYNHKKEGFFQKIKTMIIIYNKGRKIGKLSNRIEKIEGNFEECSIKKVERGINNIISKEHLIQSLKTVYYGAVGEEAVVDRFKNMHSSGILINDFKQHFDEPYFQKGGKIPIMSIQIDHIFINAKGIFLIETKNRSDKSKDIIEFGPIEQVERYGHAFYLYFLEIFKHDSYLKTQKMPNIFKVVVFMGGNKIQTSKPYLDVLYIQELRDFIERKMSKIPEKEYNYISDILVEGNEV